MLTNKNLATVSGPVNRKLAAVALQHITKARATLDHLPSISARLLDMAAADVRVAQQALSVASDIPEGSGCPSCANFVLGDHPGCDWTHALEPCRREGPGLCPNYDDDQAAEDALAARIAGAPIAEAPQADEPAPRRGGPGAEPRMGGAELGGATHVGPPLATTYAQRVSRCLMSAAINGGLAHLRLILAMPTRLHEDLGMTHRQLDLVQRAIEAAIVEAVEDLGEPQPKGNHR